MLFITIMHVLNFLNYGKILIFMASLFIAIPFPQPAYTPPEVIYAREEDTLEWRKVDVWALGITLYHMLLRRAPEWSSGGMTNTFHPSFQYVCCQEGLARILSHNGITDIPDEAVEVLQGMLREDPNRRLSTEQILNHRWLA